MFQLVLQLIKYLLVSEGSHSKKAGRIVSADLFKVSFRIGGTESKIKLFFSQAARCFYWPFSLKRIRLEQFTDAKVLVVDGVCQSKIQREEFLDFYGDLESRSYVTRDDALGFNSLLERFAYLLSSVLLLPLIAVSRNGSFVGRVFSLRLLIEVRAIQAIAAHSACSKVYIFNIFEPDSNWIADLLMEQGIHVTKIPSEVPLKFHNRNLLTHELIICNEYQREELERFHGTQHIEVVSKLWGPEASPAVFERYREMQFQPETKVGYYSSGGWLRAKLSHWEGAPKKLMEEKSIEEITDALKKIGINDLLIFLHPREKQAENVEATRQYYSELGDKLDMAFNLEEMPSSQCFDRIHLGLTTLSTIAYERIFFGFPTLILDKSTQDFPIPSSPFSNLYVKQSNLLHSEIIEVLQQTRSQFYLARQLRHYQHPDIIL